MKNMYNYKAYVINIVDGDTVDAEIDLGFQVKVIVRIRLANINAPEISSKDIMTKELALISKEKLKEKIHQQFIFLDSQGADKYGRWIGVIRLGSRVINEEMVKEGFAVPYIS